MQNNTERSKNGNYADIQNMAILIYITYNREKSRTMKKITNKWNFCLDSCGIKFVPSSCSKKKRKLLIIALYKIK